MGKTKKKETPEEKKARYLKAKQDAAARAKEKERLATLAATNAAAKEAYFAETRSLPADREARDAARALRIQECAGFRPRAEICEDLEVSPPFCWIVPCPLPWR